MEKQRYQVSQDNQEFILATYLDNDKINIECQDNNFNTTPTYRRDYSLQELQSYSEIFSFINSTMEALDAFNNAIDRQQVKITNKGEIMEILFNIESNTYSQEITLKLPIIKKTSQNNYIESGPMTQIANPQPAEIENNTNPIIMGVSGPRNDENDYPDCTYSTKPNKQIYQPQPVEVIQTVQHIPTEIGCGCIPDHDRINKIETNAQFLKGEQEGLKQRLNDLKMKIQMLNKQTADIRGENGMLNAKTLELKKQYNNLIEAEAALRAENDELRKEKHELILKKNELAFYMNDNHDHDTIKEVKIPIDDKRRRPTNVSKKEKQFGGGYSSSRINNNNNVGYSSSGFAQNNNNNYSSGYIKNQQFEEDFK